MMPMYYGGMQMGMPMMQMPGMGPADNKVSPNSCCRNARNARNARNGHARHARHDGAFIAGLSTHFWASRETSDSLSASRISCFEVFGSNVRNTTKCHHSLDTSTFHS